MTYRDELAAAQERIAALEAELARARGQVVAEIAAVARQAERDREILHAQLEQQRLAHEDSAAVERDAWRYQRDCEIAASEARAAAQDEVIAALREQVRVLEQALEHAQANR